MRSLSLKTRISLALLIAFALVAGIATVFAKASFRETEVRHVREDSQARVDAIAALVDARFLALGQSAKANAEDAGVLPAERVLEQMRRAGFTTAIALGANDTVLGTSGEAAYNDTLRALMIDAAPPAGYPATTFRAEGGWFLVSSRSFDLKTSVVGGMSQSYLSDSYLVDALIHSEYAHALVLEDGQVLASSTNYPSDRLAVRIIDDNSTSLFHSFRGEDGHFAQTMPLVVVSGHVEGLASSADIETRVDSMTTRFLLSMAVAFGLGGSITILLVAYSFRPLDKITAAARKLGRGEEDLHLEVRDRDELGALAEALNQSAAALGDARRAEAARAEEARLAAEDFELTVGDLSRSVGEAETPHDVGARLAEALLRVTPARALLVRCAEETLAVAARDAEAGAAPTLEALFASDPEAFQVARTRSGEEDLQVAILPPEGAMLLFAEMRKVDILVAQAAIAIHRARGALELKRAKAQKETFLDILSHDLKNPLAVARGRVELLGMKDAALATKLEPIEKSLERATRIIEEAVLLSKLERADELERAPLELAPIVEESVAALRPLAAPRGITLTVDSAPGARWPANRLLARAVENVLSNAIKWSPDGSPVEVRVVTGDTCRIEVVDHGPGIPMQDRQRLFARFERADRTGVKGTGLGLAIAKRVTQMHGGRILIEDTPGGGCTFVIEIPAEAQARADAQGVRA